MQARSAIGVMAFGIALTLVRSPEPASAAQVCGCKNARGRISRISQPPVTCSSAQTQVCWNQDPPPGDISARVCRIDVLTVPDSINTAVSFDNERYDTDNIHCLPGQDPTDPTCASHPASRLTAPVDGKYLIFGHIGANAAAPGLWQVAIYKNGDPIAIENHPGAAGAFSISTHHQLLKGEYVQLFVLQNSGGPVDIPAGCHPTQNYADDFGMVKLP